MKTSLVILVCLSFVLNVTSQTRKELKLYQLLEQQNFPKLQKKAKKILSKDRKNVHANYTMSAYYLQKYRTDKTEGNKKSSISKSIRYISKVDLNEDPKFQAIMDSIYPILKLNAQDSQIRKNINDQYRNWLLVYFNETVAPVHFTETKATNVVVLDSIRISDSLRFAMLQLAQKLKGVKYVYAGTSPSSGFDCSGFTQYVYKQVGIEIPHNAQMQSNLSKNRTDLKKLKPGDLVFFGSWNGSKQRTIHAGIIFDKQGDDITVIHCVSGGVSIEGKNSSWDRYWINRVLFGISLDQLASTDH